MKKIFNENLLFLLSALFSTFYHLFPMAWQNFTNSWQPFVGKDMKKWHATSHQDTPSHFEDRFEKKFVACDHIWSFAILNHMIQFTVSFESLCLRLSKNYKSEPDIQMRKQALALK